MKRRSDNWYKNEFLNSDDWRDTAMKVFIRDGLKCRYCGSGKNLQAHHVSYEHNLLDMNYIITLCKDCHKLVHREDIYQKATKDMYQAIFDSCKHLDYAYGGKFNMADYNLIQEAIDLYYINNHLGEKQIELRKSEFNAAFVIAHDKKIRSLYLMGMSKADISFNLGIDVSKVVDVIEGRKKHKLPEFIVVPEV